VFVLSLRILGNHNDSLLLSDDAVVGRVGDGHGEADVDARLNRTMSAMLFRAKSVEVSGPGILAGYLQALNSFWALVLAGLMRLV
jgi:hypothetical protein